MTDSEPHRRFCFGEFELDVDAYQLFRRGRPVPLERQPMDLLILLVESRGRLVSRTEIVAGLWPGGVFVEVDAGIHTAIRKIRRALRDTTTAPRFVETVPGRGYRFVGAIEVVGEHRTAPSMPPPEVPHGSGPRVSRPLV